MNFDLFVANIVAPPIRSDQSGYYFVEDASEILTDEIEEEIVYGQASTEINEKFSKRKYGTNLWGKKKCVPDGIYRAAAPAIQQKLRSTQKLILNMAIRRERWLASLICESDNFAAAHWMAPVLAWNDPLADPMVDIDAAALLVEEGCGKSPNSILVSTGAYNLLKHNPEIKDLIRYTPDLAEEYLRRGSIGRQLFDLELIRAGAMFNSAAPLETKAIGRIWSNPAWDAGLNWALVFYREPNPMLDSCGFAHQFVWDFNPAAPDFMGRLRSWRDEEREAWMYDFRTDLDVQITNRDAGVMIAGLGGVETD
jgi:hypothetical protein